MMKSVLVCVVAFGIFLVVIADSGIEDSDIKSYKNESSETDVQVSSRTTDNPDAEEKVPEDLTTRKDSPATTRPPRKQKQKSRGNKNKERNKGPKNNKNNSSASESQILPKRSSFEVGNKNDSYENKKSAQDGDISFDVKSSREAKEMVLENDNEEKQIRNPFENDSVDGNSTRISPEAPTASNDEEAISEENNEACPPPPEVEGAIAPRLEGTKHAVGTVANYQCNFGYVSRNSGSLSFCKINELTGKAEWTNPDMSCIPRSCGDPGYVVNGRRIGNLFTFPNNVEFECLEGYKLRGLKDRYCQTSGEWSGKLPTCEQIYCPVPSDPVNGRVLYSSLEYGSELRYECNKGFISKNFQTRFCESDGKWSNNEPECEEARCEKPKSPDHGSVQMYGDPVVGSLALYFCDEGTTMVGHSKSKCLISGNWTFDPPKCLRSCKIPAIENGEIGQTQKRTVSRYPQSYFVKFQVGDSVNHSETVTVHCNQGFDPVSDSLEKKDRSDEATCNDGEWSNLVRCQRKLLCQGEPPAVANGSPVIGSREHGSSIWYKCDTGFEKAKFGEVKCIHGTWKGETPVCSDTRCHTSQLNFPGLVKPEKAHFPRGEGFKIKCERGYKKSTFRNRMLCSSSGKWSLEDNLCTIERCENEPPRILNGRIRNFTREHGSVVYYECNEHFEKIGSSTVRCEIDIWEGEPPSCRESGKSSETSSANEPGRTSTGNAYGVTPVESIDSSDLQFDKCFCTYDYPEDELRASVDTRILQGEKKIEKGETLSLSCLYPRTILVWLNGLRVYGTVNLTCNTCQHWQSDDLPTCEPTETGDSLILYTNNMNVLPGGIIEIPKAKNIAFPCVNSFLQPLWDAGSRHGITFAVYDQETTRRTGFFAAYMIIDASDDEHSGPYKCYTYDRNKYYRSSSLNLKIAAGKSRETSSATESGRPSTGPANGVTPAKPIDPSALQFDECFCTFDYRTDVLGASVDTRTIERKERIEKGETLSLSCLYPGMIMVWPSGLRFSGIVNLTCNSCQHWQYYDLPNCETYETGDSLIIYSNNMKLLPRGIIEIPKAKRIQFQCVNYLLQPTWNAGDRKGIYFVVDSRRISNRKGFYSVYMDIAASDDQHSGTYECSIDDHYRRYKSAILHLKIAEPDIQCPELERNTKKGNFTIVYENNRKVNTKAYYSCKDSIQKLIGSNVRRCSENGSWSGSYPSCEDVRCPVLEGKGIFSITYSNGRKLHSSALFYCINRNQKLIGSPDRKCLPNGQWSATEPTCVDIICRKFTSYNGLVIQYTNDNKVNSIASFRCTQGATLIGSNTSVCLRTGIWSKPMPSCENYVSCERFQSSPGLDVSYSDDVRVGSIASFRCSPPNTVFGSSSAICRSNGTWSHDLPSCVEPKCSIGSLILPEGVIPDMSENPEEFQSPGSELRLQCEDGSVLTGSSKAICRSLGRWEVGKVRCVSGCRLNKDDFPNLLTDPVKEFYGFGEFILLSCPPGSKLSSEVERIMCLGKTWSDDIPNCTELKGTSPSGLGETTKNSR